MRLACALDCGSQRVVIANVCGMARRCTACSRYFIGCCVELLFGASDQSHRRTMLGESPGEGEADSTPTTGNHDGFAGEQLRAKWFSHEPSKDKTPGVALASLPMV